MTTPVLTSVSPVSGPPGTAITLAGAGFAAGARAGCPALVATTWVSAAEVQAAIPTELVGPAGGTLVISVYVQNPDGAQSAALPFTVVFLRVMAQEWTTVEAVCGEVPGFKRGGRIADSMIHVWIRSVAQPIAGTMMRRGLSLDPAQWQAADAGSGMPAPVGVLEHINRLGAAARLAGAIAGEFGTAEWGLAKTLQREYERELTALRGGEYDKLFTPAAATVESGTLFAGGDMTDEGGELERGFEKGQVF